MKKLLLVISCVILLIRCSKGSENNLIYECHEKVDYYAKYSDLRIFPNINIEYCTIDSSKYDRSDIMTYTFNEKIIFSGNEDLPKKILENGKNPGLGIKNLHSFGIDGEDINVAIIDYFIYPNHPEYEGKIKEIFYVNEFDFSRDWASMHGPAVTSILAGETIGTAPGVGIYYVVIPSDKNDGKYWAEGIEILIRKNKELSEKEKIKAISISAAPEDKEGESFYKDAVSHALKEGILVLDCRIFELTGIVGAGYYNLDYPEDVTKMSVGFVNGMNNFPIDGTLIIVPVGYRTVAEQYFPSKYSYMYTGVGGLSWGIPYVTGVLAMGWQINPLLTGEEIIRILFETSYVDDLGNQFIYPEKFIENIIGITE